jgi:hypothetical protein
MWRNDQILVRTPWRGRQSHALDEFVDCGLRRPRLYGLDAEALHLDVKCFLVHSKQPGRLTRVSVRRSKRELDRLALRFGRSSPADLFQGGPAHGRAIATCGPTARVFRRD